MPRQLPMTFVLGALVAAGCADPKADPTPAAAQRPPASAPEAAATAPAIPAEIRAQLPAGASLREIISGEGAIVPPVEGGESHRRHPYDLPAGAVGLVAAVRWDDPAWPDVRIAVGVGLCPHRGRELASAKSSIGSAALHHPITADEALLDDRWFLHVDGDAGLAANPGRTLRYTYALYAY